MLNSLKNKFQLRFKNRVFAAKILAGALEDSLRKMKLDKKKDSLVLLGIPRGGVIVADVIASKLSYNYELDIVIPRKLTAPHNQEIAIGAIMEDETIFLNDEIISELEIDSEYIEKEKIRQLEEIKRRKSLYHTPKAKVQDIQNKVVILVDDGAATGATVIAAARWVKRQNPDKLIIAIPVTSKDTLEILKEESDMVVTATTPSATNFKTIGQYFQEFKAVEDKEVIGVITKHRSLT